MAKDVNMRNCMILPITDYIDGALAFRVQEIVEKSLKEGSWCYYKSNSEILNILKNYKQNLQMHLRNKEVLKALAEKLDAGSLLRIDIKKEVSGATVELEILGSNGEDIYFKEKSIIDSDEPELIARTIQNWLDIYDKQIPYDGTLLGILGDQITVDIGKASGIGIGHDFFVLRSKSKKRHPLLKEIVEWEYDEIARGSIFNISEFQAQGLVKVYLTKSKLEKGDWIRISKKESPNQISKEKFPDIKAEDFGKLGLVNVDISIGNGSVNNLVSDVNKKIGGLTFGIGLGAEIWATRNLFAGMEAKREFGTYKQKVGTIALGSNSVSLSQFKFFGGYKYLPMGFFYGPQIDGILGFSRNNYNLDTSTVDSFGEASFSGLLVGVRGDAPVVQNWRAFLKFLLMFNPDYKEEVVIYGEEDSASGYEMEAGGIYQFAPNILLNGGANIRSNKAKFNSATAKEVHFKNTAFRFGASFNF
jgi:hypothetical protein